MRSRESLHSYQNDAITYLYEHDRGLALLPVGAGKSVIGWTTITELMDDGHVKYPLVIAPLRVSQLVWPFERDEWSHLSGRPIVTWGGEPSSWPDSIWKQSRILWGKRNHAESRLPKIVDTIEKRKLEDRLSAIIAEEKKVNRLITKTLPESALHIMSYESVMWLCELYKPGDMPFDLIMLDECGKVKNPKSPRYKALKKHTVHTKFTYGLNATPAPEGFFDLFAQVQIVDGPRLWGKSVYTWRQEYFYPTDWQGYNWRLKPGSKEKLLADLNTIAFRVDEADLSYAKTMTHTQIKVDMPAKARELYKEMEKSAAVEIEGHGDIVALSAASASMKLRQLTSGFVYDEDGKAHIVHEEKQNALADLIDAMQGEPLLVAYEFAEELEMIRRVYKGVPYLGQGISSIKAKENLDRWNKREYPVMALHYLSAGHGVNAQAGGSHVCWISLPWSLEGYLQLNGRVDRQGQTRACFGHHIVVRNSMDERVSDALMMKDVEQSDIIRAIRTL